MDGTLKSNMQQDECNGGQDNHQTGGHEFPGLGQPHGEHDDEGTEEDVAEMLHLNHPGIDQGPAAGDGVAAR